MSALDIYRLAPGQQARFRILPVGATSSRGARPLELLVQRPDEGQSLELELVLREEAAAPVGRGRVPLEQGYLALVKEIQRQLWAHPAWGPHSEFELQDGGGQRDLAAVDAEQAARMH